MEKEAKPTIGKRTEIYNLRSRVVSIASPEDHCSGFSPVSKVDKDEAAKGKKAEDGVAGGGRKSTLCCAPPPLTGRRLRNHLNSFQGLLLDYAKKALDSYNKGLQLPRYILVETLGMEGCALACGIVYHLNFKARPKDNPDAPREHFFAEVVINCRGLKVKETHCYIMGTESPEPATVGRKACKLCRKIYHPRGNKFIGSVVD